MSDANRAILDSYNANIVKEMAIAAGIDITHNGRILSKDALAARLESVYFSKERVTASYARLGDLEKNVLNRLLLQGGSVPTQRFRRELLRAGVVTEGQVPEHGRAAQHIPYARGYIGLPVPADSRVFEDVVARLTYHGLVFSLRHPYNPQMYKLQYHPDHVLLVPESIRPYLPEPVAVPSPRKDWQPVQVYEEDPILFVRDLYLYWDYARRNEVPILKSGLIAKRALKAINQSLIVADRSVEDAQDEREMSRLCLLRQLLEGLGLLKIQQGRLQTTGETPLDIPEFWKLSLAEQVKQCLEVWRTYADSPSMRDTRAAVYDAQLPRARRVFVEMLGKQAQQDDWRSAAELLEDISDYDMNFLIPGHGAVFNQQERKIYYNSTGPTYYYGDPAQFLKDFAEIEARFVVSCVVSILLPLGLVELGRDARHDDDPNNWHAFRLTPLGCTVLCGVSGKVVCETDTGKVVVQPNFQVMAIGPVGMEVLAQLDLFAERKRAERGAVEYQLSRQSVYQAQQAGMSVDEIVDFLEEVSAGELPQNVHRSLEEWASHHNRIVFRCGVTLVQAGRETLDGLLQDATTGKLLSRHLAGGIALVQPERNSELIATLLERGLLPMVSGADPESADRSVSIDGDGTIHSGHVVPSLHLRGRLMRVAEEKEDGTWQLTPTSVRRAGGSREKVQQMLDDLGRLLAGVLPEGLAQQIKVWGGYYGQAGAETLTLIEFSDPRTLAELSEQPPLKGLLTPFAAGDRSLAVVPTDRVWEVRKVLAGLGVELSDTLPR